MRKSGWFHQDLWANVTWTAGTAQIGHMGCKAAAGCRKLRKVHSSLSSKWRLEARPTLPCLMLQFNSCSIVSRVWCMGYSLYSSLASSFPFWQSASLSDSEVLIALFENPWILTHVVVEGSTGTRRLSSTCWHLHRQVETALISEDLLVEKMWRLSGWGKMRRSGFIEIVSNFLQVCELLRAWQRSGFVHGSVVEEVVWTELGRYLDWKLIKYTSDTVSTDFNMFQHASLCNPMLDATVHPICWSMTSHLTLRPEHGAQAMVAESWSQSFVTVSPWISSRVQISAA